MKQIQLVITAEDLNEPGIAWLPWLAVFASGFILGATADLTALWLLAHWLNR